MSSLPAVWQFRQAGGQSTIDSLQTKEQALPTVDFRLISYKIILRKYFYLYFLSENYFKPI